jgi:hypothetical protein
MVRRRNFMSNYFFCEEKEKKKKAGHIESSLQLHFTVMLDPVKQA